MTEEQIKQLKVTHVLCLDDYIFFIRYFFKLQYRVKWRQWDHLLRIAAVMKMVLEGKLTRVIINVAPRLGKTDVGVKFFIAYALALNARSKFIHLTFSDALALDNSETARDIVQSPEYQLLFPKTRIKKGSDSKHKWYTTDNGGVYATAAGGPVTGFGAGQLSDVDREKMEFEYLTEISELDKASEANEWLGEKASFAGAILLDDPNKVSDADSELLRNRVNERYDSTISNRVNSPKTPIIIFQQRTHEYDLSGYLIEKQGRIENGGLWYVLSMPSINEDGTALCPEKYTVEFLRAQEAHNDVVFQRQHMQNPKPKAGLLFPIDELHFYDHAEMQEALADPDFIYVPADPANEGGDDFAAGPFKLIGDRIYVTDLIYNTKGADHNEMALVDMVLDHKASFVGVEAVFGWKESAARVRDGLWERGWNGDFRMMNPRTHKHTRIVNRSAFIKNNFYFRADWKQLPEYAKAMRLLTSYLKIQEPGAKNKHDDMPDLCEMAAVYYEKNFPHIWAIKPK